MSLIFCTFTLQKKVAKNYRGLVMAKVQFISTNRKTAIGGAQFFTQVSNLDL
ncbi:hypothetical protein IX335_001628 [Porphyromonas levii]|nr:hypothetical protein [Porphyromonas levii]